MTKTVKKRRFALLAALIMLSGLSLVSFAQTVTQDKGVIIEAEDATYLGDTAFSDIHKGYSGRGFIAIPFSNGSGVEFTVESEFEGSVILTIGYANHQLTTQRMNLSVNGKLLKYSYAPVTGSWTKYDEYHEIIPLVKGTNTIRYSVGTDENSGFNVDYFIVGNERIDKSQLEVDVPEPSAEPEKPEQKEPLSSGKSIRYEAELAALSGGATYNANHLGYSGTGFVAGTVTGAAITYTIPSDVAGLFMMNIGYANFHGATINMSLYVNGEK